MIRALSCALGALLITGTASAANLLNNGSFEAPEVSGFAAYYTGDTSITGWTVLGASASDDIQLTHASGFAAADGEQWIDLTGNYGYDKGVRSDSIATVAGQVYRVSFAVGNYLPFGPATVGVSLNGDGERLFTNTLLDVTADAPMNWSRFSFDWVATGSTLQMAFLGRAYGPLSNDAGIGLDDVRIELAQPVPEPASWALLLVGLGALAGPARRRRQAPTR